MVLADFVRKVSLLTILCMMLDVFVTLAFVCWAGLVYMWTSPIYMLGCAHLYIGLGHLYVRMGPLIYGMGLFVC